MKCNQCNTDGGDGAFCVNCGADLKNQSKSSAYFTPVTPSQPATPPTGFGAQAMTNEYTGSAWMEVGYAILIGLSVFTLFLALPLVIHYYISYHADNLIIGGRKVKYEGTVGDIYAKIIIGILLSVITFGLYSFYMIADIKRFVVKSTVFI